MNNFLNPSQKPDLEAGTDTRRKKAEFRSNHRGSKEMDLVMGQFAERHLPGLPAEMLDLYEMLLDEEDPVLWDWVIGKSPPEAKFTTLVELLKQYTPAVQ